MNNELEKTETDDIEDSPHSLTEDDSADTEPSQSAEAVAADESEHDDMEQAVDNSPSAIDDPDIQASLKQLSLSEHSDNNIQVHTAESVKNIVEAAIHAANKPISLDKLLSLFPDHEVVDKNILRQATEQLMHDYQCKGVELVEVSSGYRFQVVQEVAPWVSRLWEEKPQKYSRALLETLALVAYRQPITRGEIEEIRGVSVSSHIMRTLTEREWVRVIGHRDVPGKPAMYATTKQFLDYFGLKKLDELPSLSEIRDLDAINAELDFGEGQQATGTDADSDAVDKQTQAMEVSQALEALEASEVESEPGADNVPEDIAAEEERIDIDIELAALKETYQQIDAIEKQDRVEQDKSQESQESQESDEADVQKPDNDKQT